jgi:acetoin utilization deacetylase AcuC-like enzyme
MDSPERVRAIIAELQSRGYGKHIHPVPRYGIEPVRRVHDSRLIGFLSSCSSLGPDRFVYPYVFPYAPEFSSDRTDLTMAGYYCFDVGTVVTQDTFTAACAAADIAVHGAYELIRNNTGQVCGLTRPPGHHADRHVYGGLCFFNNAAIAARQLSDHGRTAVLDLDLHHGNGTQGIFYRDPEVLYVSIHASPEKHFPFFCGHADETGAGDGEGANMNMPLDAGTDFPGYMLYVKRAFSWIQEFSPEFLVVSMGFDTFARAPLGDFHLPAEGFFRLGRDIRRTGYPILACLEGGYDAVHLGIPAADFIEGLLDLR